MPTARSPRKTSSRSVKKPRPATKAASKTTATATAKSRSKAPRATKPGAPQRSARSSARSRKTPPLRIGCVYVMVRDMGRAVDFYTGGLGLPLVVRYDDEWAEVDAGDVRLGLHPTDSKVKGEGGATLSFYVTDLDVAATRVRDAGGTMGAIHNTARGRMSMGRDTEGNGLHFSEFDPGWVRRARYPLQKWARRG